MLRRFLLRRPALTSQQARVLVLTGLHDTSALLRQPMFWASVAAGIFLTALAGPFGTFHELGFAARLIYWGVAILVPSVLASTLSMVFSRFARALGLHWLVAAVLAGVLVVPPSLGAVLALEAIFVPQTPRHGLAILLPMVGWPVVIVTLLVNWLLVKFDALRAALTPTTRIEVTLPPPRATAAAPSDSRAPHLKLVEPVVEALPLLFQRIPPDLGQDLVCLRAQDHYLEVTTTRGSALVLMRLSDAERDLAAVKGMRVHRSWWVALDHVACFSRGDSGGVTLLTTTGQQVPVARGQRDALRDALSRHREAAE